MTNRRRFLAGATAVLAVSGSGLAYKAYENHNVRLSIEPSQIAKMAKLAARETKLALRANIPLSLIRDAASQAIPAEFNFGGNGPDVGGTINLGGWNIVKVDVKAGTRYEGVVRRGELSVTGSGNTVVVALPIQISGNGGLRGDGARMLGLQAKNFRAALILRVRLSVDVNPDWTPAVTVVPELEWTQSPSVEIASRAWIDIRSHVTEPLRDQLEAMAAKIREAIPADIIKREVEKAWRVYSVSIGNAAGFEAWAHVVPLEIGTSGVTVENDHISIGVSLKANTEVSTQASTNTKLLPLPALVRQPAGPGRLSIALPVRAAYDVIRAAVLAEVRDRAFSADIPGGKAKVVVKDAVVYPSDDKIAIGLSFEASMPGRLFNVAGKLFLTGKPVVENDGMVIRLTDIAFARRLDNPLWTIASVIFEEKIKKAIGEAARIDLEPEIAKRSEALRAALADPSKTQGVKVTIRDLKAGVEAIVPEATALAAQLKERRHRRGTGDHPGHETTECILSRRSST